MLVDILYMGERRSRKRYVLPVAVRGRFAGEFIGFFIHQ